jgi:hypothetical protein
VPSVRAEEVWTGRLGLGRPVPKVWRAARPSLRRTAERGRRRDGGVYGSVQRISGWSPLPPRIRVGMLYRGRLIFDGTTAEPKESRDL